MADDNSDNDIYDDPATIGATDDDVNGAPDNTPPSDETDLSESIYTPEKNTTDKDDRGAIDELEIADRHDTSDVDRTVDPALLDDRPSSTDGDNFRLNDEETGDERDGTEE
ncbi:MAG: hypothetical protein JWP13_60 [Candidatus Saccharibacteria bacterium]|nr:hypothetical protein [Candidatus Saccharibacteria bacterium]